MSGLEVLRALRRDGVTTPVIILSAKGDEIDRVVGLKIGADDYVAKPFSRPELLARIEAVLRRHRREADEPERRGAARDSDRVAIDVARREVTVVGDEPIHLTTKEFDLLAHMAASRAGSSPATSCWRGSGATTTPATGGRSTSTSAGCAASCAGRDGHNYFRTVRGVGYAFTPRTGVNDPTTQPPPSRPSCRAAAGDLLILVDDAPADRPRRPAERPPWPSDRSRRWPA